MPLTRIHILKDTRSPKTIRKLADAVQKCITESLGVSWSHRYQIITQHEPHELLCDNSGLDGVQRTNKLVLIEILQVWREGQAKQRLYATLCERLNREMGLAPSDLIVVLGDNTEEDWSFAMGKPQYLTGDLAA